MKGCHKIALTTFFVAVSQAGLGYAMGIIYEINIMERKWVKGLPYQGL